MISPVRPQYRVTGSIGTDDMTAYVIIDKKNNSIHIHFYSKMFGNQRKPILTKHTDMKFPEGEDVDLVKQIIVGELPNKNVQIGSVTAMREKEAPAEQPQPPQRIIIRFKK